MAFLKAIKEKKVSKFSIAFLFNLLLVELFKYSFKTLRPHPFNNPLFDYSFFSGHSCLAMFSAYFCRNNPIYIIWALLIVLSRLALGVHSIIDIIGGITIGITISFLIDKNYEKWKKRIKKEKKEIIRKLLHLVFYTSFIFVLYWNETYFKVYLIFSIMVLIILSELNRFDKLNIFKNPLFIPLTTLREKEKNKRLFHIIFPVLFILFLYLIGLKKLIIYVLIVLGIGDGLVGLFYCIFKKYILSLLTASFFLFLITSMYFNTNKGIITTVVFIIGDLIAKRLKINDNYFLPVFSALVFKLFLS